MFVCTLELVFHRKYKNFVFFINLGGLHGEDNNLSFLVVSAALSNGIIYSLSLSIVKSDKSDLLEYEYEFKEKSQLPIGSLANE